MVVVYLSLNKSREALPLGTIKTFGKKNPTKYKKVTDKMWVKVSNPREKKAELPTSRWSGKPETKTTLSTNAKYTSKRAKQKAREEHFGTLSNNPRGGFWAQIPFLNKFVRISPKDILAKLNIEGRNFIFHYAYSWQGDARRMKINYHSIVVTDFDTGRRVTNISSSNTADQIDENFLQFNADKIQMKIENFIAMTKDQLFHKVENIDLSERDISSTSEGAVPSKFLPKETDFGHTPSWSSSREGRTQLYQNLSVSKRLESLKNAEVVCIKGKNTGVTGSYHVWLQNDPNTEGMWKPSDEQSMGESIWGLFPAIPEGSLPQREVAAYAVDKALGLDLVPITTLREINEVTGSVQEWLADAHLGIEEDDFELFFSDKQDQLIDACTLTFLLLDEDRHESNFMCSSRGVHYIDNGFTLPEYQDIRNTKFPIFYELAEKKPITKKMANKLADDNMWKGLVKNLRKIGISNKAIDALYQRAQHLLDSGKVPHTMDLALIDFRKYQTWSDKEFSEEAFKDE